MAYHIKNKISKKSLKESRKKPIPNELMKIQNLLPDANIYQENGYLKLFNKIGKESCDSKNADSATKKLKE